MHKMFSWTLFSLILLMVAACGGPSQPPVPIAPLECQIQKYPCTWSEVSSKVLERSDALGDEAVKMFKDGMSAQQVLAWIKSQSGVAEAQAEDTALRFRLEGGRAVWLLLTNSFNMNQTPLSPTITPQHVVGGDGPAKHALVLSPAKFEFGETDDGAGVAQTLGSTKGYGGNVTYRENATLTSTQVGVASFLGWQSYQVIHVASHGGRICQNGVCRATVMAQPYHGNLLDLLTSKEKGVELIKSQSTGQRYLALAADFFRQNYPGGLKNTLVFFNACQTFGPEATDLGDALRGSTSVFLGWTGVVDSGVAESAALTFYSKLKEGFSAKEAMDSLGKLQHSKFIFKNKTYIADLAFGSRSAGGDLRIREIVSLKHPITYAPLNASDKIAINGFVKDGLSDKVGYLVQVDGIAQDKAGSVAVHMLLDGKEVVRPLSEGQFSGGVWFLSGEVALGYDLPADKKVALRAWVELPDGGISQQQSEATLTGQDTNPPMGQIWSGKTKKVSPAIAGVFVTVEAVASFGYKPGQAANTKFPVYTGLGGTLTWHIGGTTPEGCTYKASDEIVPIPPSNFDNITFDLSKNPVEYEGYGSVKGVEVEVEVTCPNKAPYTYHTSTGTVWFIAPASEQYKVGGNTLAGAYQSTAKVEWEFTRVK